jgi:hypothetical protein
MSNLPEEKIQEFQNLTALVGEYDTAPPERQEVIVQDLEKARAADVEDNRRDQVARVAPMFQDLETLGGTWTHAQEKQFAAGTSDLSADKAAIANIKYLAAVTGHDEQDVNRVLPMMREDYARNVFGKENLDDKAFYSLVQSRYAKQKRHTEEMTKLAATIEDAAFSDALDGKPADWASAYGKLDTKAFQEVDSDAAWNATREIYTRAHKLADENKPLMLIAKDVLAREMGREVKQASALPVTGNAPGAVNLPRMHALDVPRETIDTGRLKDSPDAMAEAVDMLAAKTPDERRAVWGMLKLWAAQHGETKRYFLQLEESLGRSAGSMVRGFGNLLDDQQLARARKELLSDNPLAADGRPLTVATLSTSLTAAGNAGMMPTASGGPVAPILPHMRSLNSEERLKLIGDVDHALRVNQITRELRAYGESDVDPIRDILPKDSPWILHRLERGSYGIAATVPYLAAASVPMIGVGLASAGIAGQEYDRVRLQFPDMPIEDAAAISVVSGSIQGAIERLQVGQVMGRLPKLEAALRNLSTPTSSFWKRFAPSVAGDIAKQNLEELAQDVTTPVVEYIVAALKGDEPGEKWDSQLGGFNGRVETFISLLPFTLVGTGLHAAHENEMVRQALHIPEQLAYTGIDLETATKIAETAKTDENAAEVMFREAWQGRTKENIAQGAAMLDERLKQAEAMQKSPETPTVRRTAADRFELRSPAGEVLADFDTEEAAQTAATDSVRQSIEQDDRGTRRMIAFINERDPERQFEMIDQDQTLKDQFDAVSDPAERERILPRLIERMRLAGLAIDEADPVGSLGRAWVLGENVVVQDRLFQSVSRLYRGANAFTVVEETAEGFTKQALHSGRVDKPTLEGWLRGVQDQLGTPLIAGEVATDQELIEGMSRTATAYMAGKLRKEGLAAGLRSVLAQFMQFFKETFRLAGGMLRMKAQGKLDADFETFLAESVGLNAEHEYTRAAEAQHSEILGVGAADTNTKGPADPREGLDLKDWIAKRVSEGLSRDEAIADFDSHKKRADDWLDSLPPGTRLKRPGFSIEYVKDAGGILRADDGSIWSGTVWGAEVVGTADSGKTFSVASDALRAHLQASGVSATVLDRATAETSAALESAGAIREESGLPTGEGGSAASGRVRAERDDSRVSAARADNAAIADPLSLELAGAVISRKRVSSLLHEFISREIPGFDIAGAVIANSEDFAKLLLPLRSPYFESMKVAFVDRDGVVMHSQILHVGSLAESVAHPRDVLIALQDAKRKSPRITGALIAHNHPSGDPSPSGADIKLTARIKDVLATAGIEMLDHVITNGERFYSFKDLSLTELSPVHLAEWEAVPRGELLKIQNVGMLHKLIANLRQHVQPDTMHLAYLTTRMGLTAVERTTAAELVKAFTDGIGREAPYGVMIDAKGLTDPEASPVVREAQRLANAAGVVVLEVSTAETRSWNTQGMLSNSYAIAPAVYMEQLAARVDRAASSPEERLAVWERAKEKLQELRDSPLFNQEEETPESVDYASAARAEAAATLEAKFAKLDAEEKAALATAAQANLDNFMARIEAAKDDATKKALEREAKARASEQKKGIRAVYAEKRSAARAEVATERKAGVQGARDDAKRETQRIAQGEARTRLLQAFATLDAITGAMPAEIRGTIGGFAYTKLTELRTAKARTEFIESRIDQLDVALERLLRDGYREALDKLLHKSQPAQGESRVQKSKLGPEAQKLAQQAYDASLLDEDATAAKLTSLEAEMVALTSNEEKDDGTDRAARQSDLAESWGIVNLFGAIDKRSAAELSNALQWLQQVTSRGRTLWRTQEEARLEGLRKDKQSIIDFLGKRTRAGLKRKRSEKESVTSNLDAYMMDLYAFHQFVRDILPPELAERLARSVRKQTGKFESDMLALVGRFRAAVAEAAGLESTKGVFNYLKMGEALARLNETLPGKVEVREGMTFKTVTLKIELAEKYVRGEATGHGFSLDQLDQIRAALAGVPSDTRKENIRVELKTHGGEVEMLPMSRWEAMQFRLSWDQADVRAKMERQGFSAHTMRQIDELLNDHFSRRLLALLRTEYKGDYALTNPVYRRIHGMNMPKIHRHAPTGYEVGPISDADMDLSMFGASPSAASMSAGFTKTRVSHNEMLAQQSAIKVLWRSKTTTTYWRHFAELVREMRGIFSDPKVYGAIQQAHGDAKAKKLKTWIDRLATNGGAASAGMEFLDRFLNRALSRQSAALLGFNTASVIKQMDSGLRYWQVLSPKDALRGTRDLLMGQLNKTVAAAWKSESVQRRVLAGMSPEIRLSMAEESMKPSVLLWLRETGFLPMQHFDAALTSISSAIVYDAAYRKARAEGMNEATAEGVAGDLMDKAVFETAQPASVANRSLAETSGNAWLRALTLFGSDPRLKIAQEYEVWKGFAKGKIDIKTAATRIFMLHFYGLITQLAADLFRDAFTGDDDEEIYKSGNYWRALAFGNLNGAFVIGQGLWYLGQRLAGGFAYNDSENPVMRSADAALKLWNDPGKLIDFDDPEAMAKAWRDALRAIAPFSDTAAGIAPVANALKDAVGAAENLSSDDK